MIMMGDKRKTVHAIMGEPHKEESHEMDHESMMDAIGEEAMNCIHEKDHQGFVRCMEALFRAFDAEPHQEGPHE